jgi:hypothetical protein
VAPVATVFGGVATACPEEVDPRARGKTIHRAQLGARKGRYFRMFTECATSVRSFVAVNFPSNAIRRAWGNECIDISELALPASI